MQCTSRSDTHSDHIFRSLYTPSISILLYRNEITSVNISTRKLLNNSPLESFFGHFKDEVDYKEAKGLAEKYIIGDYIKHYNNIRKQ